MVLVLLGCAWGIGLWPDGVDLSGAELPDGPNTWTPKVAGSIQLMPDL
jgi:hypothetical protein